MLVQYDASDCELQSVSPARKLSPKALAKHTRRFALEIANQGGRVFPMRFIKDDANGKARKVPAIKGWPEKATGEHERIDRFFARPGPGIGIATEASGWIVLDTDQKPGIDGDANLRAWLGEHAHYLDETETIQTPSGSKHYRFTGDPVKSSSSVLAPGVDVKSRGGYVVGEGSVTLTGGVYRVIANGGTRLPLPQPIIDLIANAYTAAAKPRMATDVPGDDPTDIASARSYLAEARDIDGYNNAMNLARKLWDLGITTSTAIVLFDEEINPRLPHYPWERDELEKKMPEWYDNCENAFGCDSVTGQFGDLDLRTPAEIEADIFGEAPANDNDEAARDDFDMGEIDLAADKPLEAESWHVEGLIPGDNVTLLYGDGGVGKSLTALQLAVATVLDSPWLGRPVRQGPAIFITAEDTEKQLRKRLAAVAQEYGVSVRDLRAAGLLVFSWVDAADPALGVAEDNRIKPTKRWRRLVRMVETMKPKFVGIDTLADVFAGNENDRTLARGFIAQIRKPAVKHDAAFMVLAHPSRSGLVASGFNSAAGSSGSTGWHNSVRARLNMERDNDKDVDSRLLTCLKVNEGAVGQKLHLRWDAGVFKTKADTVNGGEAEVSREAERVFLQMLDAYTAEKRYVVPTTGRGYAPHEFSKDARCGFVTKDDLTAAMNRLYTVGAIETIDVGSPSRPNRRIVRAAGLEEAA